MRKPQSLIILFFLCLTVLSALPAKGMIEQEVEQENGYQVIPDEAIRLRILANSDQENDQTLKREIRDIVNADITKWVAEIDDIEEARQEIRSRLPEIEQIVGEVLEDKGIDQTYTVEYGKDVKFPTKVYGSYIYPAGSYEAILITLGEGKGANWWCVLFPPLCFLDFSDGTTVADETEKGEEKEETTMQEEPEDKPVEVKFFFLRWFM